MTATPFASADLNDLFLGRQPVLDQNGVLVGYELLFRDSRCNRAPATLPDGASADVVCKAFAEFGLASALGGSKAFVIADAAFLCHALIEALPAERVVFEVAATELGAPALLERCQELQQQGYPFCLRDPTELDETVLLFLRLAMFMKLDIQNLDDARAAQLLNLPADFRPLSIASRVERHAHYQRAQQLGFQFFQGYFFAAPVLIEGKTLDPATQGLIRLVNLIQADADTDDIERAFKSEAALTVKLLRLTNSAGIGLRTRIGSVRQAVNLLGRRHLQRWLQLLLFSRHGRAAEFERNPLMQLAALKGRFMESLVGQTQPRNRELADQAFLVGMMSLMPAALELPMAKILEQIDMAETLRNALLEQSGELGRLLQLTECFDNEDIPGTRAALAAIGPGFNADLLNRCLTDAIAWVQSVASAET